MNSGFFHSSMACFAIGAQEFHEERSGGRVHGRFLACLHCVTNSSKFRFIYSPMACFAIGAQIIAHFSQDRVQQHLHPQRELAVHHVSNTSVYVGVTLFAERLDFFGFMWFGWKLVVYFCVATQISSEVRHCT